MHFNKFNFHPDICSSLGVAGYTKPTSIQNETIPPILEGKDVLGLAQTGTGKTAAFVLPILQRLVSFSSTKRSGLPGALIMAPTRELADQMLDMGFLPDIKRIIRYLPKTRQSLVFSATMPKQIQDLVQTILHRPVEVNVDHTLPTPQVSHVINYDLPDTVETYIHRTGRTGRADQSGQAYTFATAEDRKMISLIEKALGKKMLNKSVVSA